MSNNLVPKVIITEAVQSLAVPRDNQVVIGMIGTSATWTANTVYNIASVSQADTIFWGNYSYGATLWLMIRRAFAEWASLIRAVSIWQPTTALLWNDIMSANSLAGADTITVVSTAGFTNWNECYIGTGQTYGFEEKRTILAVTPTTIQFTAPLTFPHYIGEIAQEVTAKITTDYDLAIQAMLEDEQKTTVVCELNDNATAVKLEQMCIDSRDKYNTPCVYFRGAEATDDATSIIAKAQAQNSDKVIIWYPLLTDFNWKTVTSWEAAAALCWAIAWNWVPKLNHNFTAFDWFGWVVSKISDMDALISAWVTPIELKYSSIHIVRLVTTSTTTNSVPDKTRQEWAVRLNVDFIEKAITKVLQQKFLQQGNTAQVREAMKAEVSAMLQKYAAMDILVADTATNTPAFREPVVSTDPNDNTKVNVDVEIAPGKPLNFISLNFKVYL